MQVDMSFKKNYKEVVQERYFNSTKAEKSKILDEYCNMCNYNRKYAIRSLSGEVNSDASKRPGPKPKYPQDLVCEPLGRIWLMAGCPCSKFFKPMIKDFIGSYAEKYEELPEDVVKMLLSISAPTIDRLLNKSGFRVSKGLSGTTAGTLLKKEIKLSENNWDNKCPGFFEADTVAMCGDSIAGQFIWCLNMTDIASGWTEARACWGKSSEAVLNRIKEVEKSLSIPMLGFDCDNGSEFLNYKTLEYFQKRKKPVQFTRSRPYKKNDNAHIEQRNYSYVRKLLGYYRYDLPELTCRVNNLLINWCKFKNFFVPCQKTVEKKRVGGKIKRIMDEPLSPYRRLLKSQNVCDKIKNKLAEEFKSINPIELKLEIDKELRAILKILKVSNFHNANV